MPGARGLTGPHRQHPGGQATADPARATQASAQRRVSNASMEKPTPNTNANQTNTRDGSATDAPAP